MLLHSLWALHAEKSLLRESLREQAPLLAALSRQVFKGQGKKSTLIPTDYSLHCYKLLKLEVALENRRTITGFLKAPTLSFPKEETGDISESHYHHQWRFLLH